MAIPPEATGILFQLGFRMVSRLRGKTLNDTEISAARAKKRDLLMNVAGLARVPDQRREPFVRLAAGIIGYWMSKTKVSARIRGSTKLV
jgi:hypothetical protein